MKRYFLLALIISIILQTQVFASIRPAAICKYNEGIYLAEYGDYEGSAAKFEESVKLDPNFLDAYYNLASTYEFLKKYDMAIPVYEKILIVDPTDKDAPYHLAKLYYWQGSFGKSSYYIKKSNNSKYHEELKAIQKDMDQKIKEGKANKLFVIPLK